MELEESGYRSRQCTHYETAFETDFVFLKLKGCEI